MLVLEHLILSMLVKLNITYDDFLKPWIPEHPFNLNQLYFIKFNVYMSAHRQIDLDYTARPRWWNALGMKTRMIKVPSADYMKILKLVNA